MPFCLPFGKAGELHIRRCRGFAVGDDSFTLGAEVELSEAPLKYAGLSYAEIWISEAQERMVLAVPPERLAPRASAAPAA